MKILFYSIVFILISSLIDASPYVAWNPNDLVEVEAYQVELNGDIIDVPATTVNNVSQCIFDLVDIPVGRNSVRARLKAKVWPEWTEWSELYIIMRPKPLENPHVISNP